MKKHKKRMVEDESLNCGVSGNMRGKIVLVTGGASIDWYFANHSVAAVKAGLEKSQMER